MSISFSAVSPTVGVQVHGLDISQPLDEETVRLLRGKMHEHGLLLLRIQELDDAQQLRFALYFGKISKQGAIQKTAPATTYVSNVRSDGTFGKGELGFHSDQTYYAHPMKAIMLYGLEVPAKGGETLFVNTAAIVSSLTAEQRREFDALEVLHEFDYGALDYGTDKKKEVQALKVSAVHPVIACHPKVIPASTEATFPQAGGMTKSRYARSCFRKSSMEGMETTRTCLPYSLRTVAAASAICTSDPVAIIIASSTWSESCNI